VHAQPGIFALGTTEHAYLELDLRPGADPAELVARLAALSGPETTVGGLNAVVAFRPELWAGVAGSAARTDVSSFEAVGAVMPATQHDAWVWLAGGARDVVWDSALRVLRAVADIADVASEVNGWLYQHDRDLTGFIDGTENPSMLEAPDVAIAADGSSIVLVQQWRHEASFAALGVEEQERVIGRTKDDSTELDEDVMPADSHVSRTVVVDGGAELEIYRRNTAYGGATQYGTMFVAFCREVRPFQLMLERMAGVGDGTRDALTRHTTALTGAYYVVPSTGALGDVAAGPT